MKIKYYFNIAFIIIFMLLIAGCKDSKSEDTVKETDMIEGAAEQGDDAEVGENIETEDALDEDEIAFSLTDYFYADDIELEIQSNKPGKIYYTLDGKDPNEKQKLYQEAIKLKAEDEVKATCVKAKEYYEDGTESETIVHTYFVGKNVENRFDTLVFSVTTDPYNLYDDEYGIFVEGKLRRDYIKDNPDDKIEPNDPANYNMRGTESEREVYLEIVESDGTKVAGQAAGIRTYGGWSRANNQKSIKIFARKEYDDANNKIRYEFFPFKTAANGDGSTLDTFKQLVLRNCGNDNGFAFIRDELFQTLARQAGYPDNEAVRPVTLFVNGDYRGFFWLHEVYCDEYFEDHYGDYTGRFEILEGGETYKNWDENGENEFAISDYEDMYNTYSQKDLTDNIAFNELSQLLDIENYLSYYALQVYIGNEDWPWNNYKTYRYYVTEGENYREAPFDGKWRYLFHDLDFSFGIYGTGALVDNIDKFVGKNGEIREVSPLFGQLMRREDCKEIFIKKTLDLINGAFTPENINQVLEEMNTSRLNELKNMYNKNLIADWVQYDQLEGRLEDIKNYGAQRAGHILMKYQEYFNMKDIYQLTVQPSEGGKVKINSFVTDEYFEGNYYSNYNTVIMATMPEGKEFDYWTLNGERVEGKELVITASNIKDGKVNVICVAK